MVDLNRIVAEIEMLSPDERRRLQRRLHATGIFVPEELLSDRSKLERAISVRIAVADESAPENPLQLRTNSAESAPGKETSSQRATRRVPEVEDVPPVPTRNFISAKPKNGGSGKIVIGTPSPAQGGEDPHRMAPLPGQPPEGAIGIVFDGGSRGNPGEGYGSYQLRWPGNPPQVVRLNFGNNYTNNEAEYDTLISAIESVLKRLKDMQIDASLVRLEMRGDSLLVVNQVTGVWKVKDARMAERRDRIRTLLRNFAGWTLTHHDRVNSVRELGH